MKRNPFEVLGVDPKARPEQIRAAYRKLVRVLDPDGDEPDAERLAEVHDAYERLLRFDGAVAVEEVFGLLRASRRATPAEAEVLTAEINRIVGIGPPGPRGLLARLKAFWAAL